MYYHFNLITVFKNKVSTTKSNVVIVGLSFKIITSAFFLLGNSFLPHVPEAFNFRDRLISENSQIVGC